MEGAARRAGGGILGDVCLFLLAAGIVFAILQPSFLGDPLARLEGTGLAHIWRDPMELASRYFSPGGWQAAAPKPEQPPAAGEQGRHRVAAGDTLGSIGFEYGVSVAALARANALARPDLLTVGQTLVIPGLHGPSPELPAVASGPPDDPNAVDDLPVRAQVAPNRADFARTEPLAEAKP